MAIVKFFRIIVAALAFSVLANTGAVAKVCDAEPFVISAGKAFMSAAAKHSPSAFANAAARFADLRALALFSLGPYRSKLPKSHEAEYFALAKVYMGEFMAKYSGEFKGSAITVLSCQPAGKRLTVNAKFTGGQKVVFRLYKSGGGYRVEDVSVSSIWMAQQMRTKFVGIIRRGDGSVDSLLRYLRTN